MAMVFSYDLPGGHIQFFEIGLHTFERATKRYLDSDNAYTLVAQILFLADKGAFHIL